MLTLDEHQYNHFDERSKSLKPQNIISVRSSPFKMLNYLLYIVSFSITFIQYNILYSEQIKFLYFFNRTTFKKKTT